MDAQGLIIYSNIRGKVPTVDELPEGYLFINTFDNKIYSKEVRIGVETIVELIAGDAVSTSVKRFTAISGADQTDFVILDTITSIESITINGITLYQDEYSFINSGADSIVSLTYPALELSKVLINYI